jgi:hypothetical protein
MSTFALQRIVYFDEKQCIARGRRDGMAIANWSVQAIEAAVLKIVQEMSQ